jgi:hypothetical protein
MGLPWAMEMCFVAREFEEALLSDFTWLVSLLRIKDTNFDERTTLPLLFHFGIQMILILH